MDHHHSSAQNKIQCFHCIPHMRKPRHIHQKYASILLRLYIKSYVQFYMSSNVSDGHLGFMQIRKVPQSCHSGKRWIWLQEALSNTNPSKKITVPTISGFTMGHIQLATQLCCVKSPPVVWRQVSRPQASQQVSGQVLVAYFSRSATQVPARRCCRLSPASLP